MALFWLKSSWRNIFWPIKLTFWIFVIFCNHFKEDLKFGYFNPLAPTLWGTPLAHLLHDLPWNLCYPTSLTIMSINLAVFITQSNCFKLLYLLNRLSHRSQTGLKRKIFRRAFQIPPILIDFSLTMVVFSSEDSRKLASFIDPMVKYEDFWQNYDHFCNTLLWGLCNKNASIWPWQANCKKVVWSEESVQMIYCVIQNS